MKKYFIETYGCQMNVSLSDQLDEKMKQKGFKPSASPEKADFIIVNACSVREHAENRVFQRLLYLHSLKKKKDIKIVATSCFAQNQKENIHSADYILGTYQISSIPDILSNGHRHFLKVEFDEYEFLKPVRNRENPFQSLIDITVGCNNFCSYCIVPYLRGPQISRPSKQIIEEVKRLGDEGVIEIFLLGQNVNSYGKDSSDISFAGLLYKIHEIDNIKRIKFLTSHPKDFDKELIQAVMTLPKLSRWLHLPLQSGSDRVLQLMNRKYSMAHYYDIVDRLRSYKKDFAQSTDILVGFPGETEKDYQETLTAINNIGFDEAFTFKYSPRKGTRSYALTDSVPEKEKRARLENLVRVQRKTEKEKIIRHIGQGCTVLVEGQSKKEKNDAFGRDDCNRVVIIKGQKLKKGEFYPVRITGVKGLTLLGERQ
ncbi:MAG: tRNA (N6-isopentenyl adenosine(37)-C2)-methylthiotransferase MiaB [Spirochaetes bacterium]|nr:tRNA (N6-isopentenyl adenosine(37)-C2)-methylthiotransferase MiaB [Spirochaetota bacterium]